MRDLAAWIVFFVMQILFIPLAIAGIALSMYAQTVVSKKRGVSGTALNVAAERSLMDRFGIREDRAAGQLVKALSNLSMIGGWLILFPWQLRYKISGKRSGYPALSTPGQETVANMVADRTLIIDRLIAKLRDQVAQFVSLGAGYDTRCYGSLKGSKLRFYELDQAATQRLKRESLQKAGIDASHVHFVEVDFSIDTWAEALLESGYDPGLPTLFLWEGVTLYLSEEAVRKTLRAIQSVAAQGSILVCDFYAASFISGQYSRRGRMVGQSASLSGEGLGFGLDFADDYRGALVSFLASEGLVAGDMHFLGANTKAGVFMAVAEIML